MKKFILFSLFFLTTVFAVENSDYSNVRIFDPNGSVLYQGQARLQGSQLEISHSIPNGVHFLDASSSLGNSYKKIIVSNSGIQVTSSDSVESSTNRNDLLSNTNRMLRKEVVDATGKNVLRTNIFAVNGILNDNIYEPQQTFKLFFAFCANDLQTSYPKDTIYTDLIFNKSAGGMKADLIQSILIKAEDFGIDMDAIHGWDLLSMNVTEFLKNNSIEEPASITALAEFIQTKLDEFNEILTTNEQTELALNNAISTANQNKSRVFVLGHSQGGMYTSKAFNNFSSEDIKHFYSINVAATTDNNPNWFLANKLDKVVNAIRYVLPSIPEGEDNFAYSGNFENDYGGANNRFHTWRESYYNPNLASYTKINEAVKNAFSSVPYWESDLSIDYMLIWYNAAAQTTIEIALEDGSFKKLGTYQGYNVTDNTIVSVSNPKITDGLPLLRVTSYHHSAWWGPYLSTNPRFFKVISQENGIYTYLMSDAWSPDSFDDAEFSITLKLVNQ